MFVAILSHCHRLGTPERKHHYLEIQTTLMNQIKNNEAWKAGLKQKQASKACLYNQKNPYERNLKLKMHKVEKPKYRERRTSKGNMEKGGYKVDKKRKEKKGAGESSNYHAQNKDSGEDHGSDWSRDFRERKGSGGWREGHQEYRQGCWWPRPEITDIRRLKKENPKFKSGQCQPRPLGKASDSISKEKVKNSEGVGQW